jgi:hypothetical protein
MATPKENRESCEYLDEDGLNADYLIPPRTASRWRGSGDGPPFIRLGKRRILYRRADVETWMASRTFASLADEAAGRIRCRADAATTTPAPAPPRNRQQAEAEALVAEIGDPAVSDVLDAVSDKVPATRRHPEAVGG